MLIEHRLLRQYTNPKLETEMHVRSMQDRPCATYKDHWLRNIEPDAILNVCLQSLHGNLYVYPEIQLLQCSECFDMNVYTNPISSKLKSQISARRTLKIFRIVLSAITYVSLDFLAQSLYCGSSILSGQFSRPRRKSCKCLFTSLAASACMKCLVGAVRTVR